MEKHQGQASSKRNKEELWPEPCDCFQGKGKKVYRFRVGQDRSFQGALECKDCVGYWVPGHGVIRTGKVWFRSLRVQ